MKAVTRPLPIAHPRECAIQAVPQPIYSERAHRKQQSITMPTRPGVRKPTQQHAEEADNCEVIGIDPGWCTLCQPYQYFSLYRGDKALLNACRRRERRLSVRGN